MVSAPSPGSARAVQLRAALVVLIVVVLCFIYVPSVLNNDYAWDDWELFINSPYLRDPSLVFEGIVKPVLPGTTYFRPLPLATFAIEFAGGSVDPILSHAVNFFIHVVNTFLVGYVFFKVFFLPESKNNWNSSILAAAIYAVHPALVESVAWAAGRFDLLVTLFYLGAIAVYLKLDGGRRLFLLFPIYLAACFSKEMAVTLPIALLLIEFYQAPADGSIRSRILHIAKNTAPSLMVLIAAGLIYILAKYHFMGRLAHVNTDVMSDFKRGGLDHLGFVAQTFIFYLKMMVWPFASLSPHHPFVVKDMEFARIVLGLVFSCAIALGVAYAAARKNASAIFFAIAIVCLLPVLNIIPLTIGGNIGHERFLALPLAFFAMAVAAFPMSRIAEATRATRVVIPSAIGISAIWLVLAIVNVKITAPLWQNDFTLWKWAYDSNPRFYIANIGYAGAAVRYQKFELAKEILEHAKTVSLRGEENVLPAGILEARLLGRQGKFLEAAAVLQDSRSAVISKYRESEKFDGKDSELSIGPRLNSVYYTALAEAYVGAANFLKAKDAASTAVSYGAAYPLAWLQYSFASYGIDDWTAGEKQFLVAKRLIANIGTDKIDEMRNEFLTKLCANGSKTPAVCTQFGNKK